MKTIRATVYIETAVDIEFDDDGTDLIDQAIDAAALKLGIPSFDIERAVVEGLDG